MEIGKKLLKAVSEMGEPELSGVNPHFKSRYATLDDIKKVSDPALRANGLRDYLTTMDDGFIALIVADADEEVVGCRVRYTWPEDIQKLGSAITYLERYLRLAAYALRGGEDDDGNAASEQVPDVQRRPKPKAQPKVDGQPAPTRDNTRLNGLTKRFAAATGTSVSAAAQAIVAKYGNPREMGDAAYQALVFALENEVRNLEEGYIDG